MNGKTQVKMKDNDNVHKEWKKGETGYIDGYVFNGERPCCMVVLSDKLIICLFHELEIINN